MRIDDPQMWFWRKYRVFWDRESPMPSWCVEVKARGFNPIGVDLESNKIIYDRSQEVLRIQHRIVGFTSWQGAMNKVFKEIRKSEEAEMQTNYWLYM